MRLTLAALLALSVAFTAYLFRANALVEAELEQALRTITVRNEALASYQLRLRTEQAASQARRETLEAEIARYEEIMDAAGRDCRLHDGDVRWLRE